MYLGYISVQDYPLQPNSTIADIKIVSELLSMCLLMNACGIFYAVYYLKEVPRQEDTSNGENEWMNDNAIEMGEPRVQIQSKITVKYSEIFNLNILKDGLRVVVRKRKYNGRSVVILLFIMAILYNGVYSGWYSD